MNKYKNYALLFTIIVGSIFFVITFINKNEWESIQEKFVHEIAFVILFIFPFGYFFIKKSKEFFLCGIAYQFVYNISFYLAYTAKISDRSFFYIMNISMIFLLFFMAKEVRKKVQNK